MINTAKRLLLRSVAAPNTSIAERGLTEKDVRVGFVNGMPGEFPKVLAGRSNCYKYQPSSCALFLRTANRAPLRTATG